jgi:hypothetical protein
MIAIVAGHTLLELEVGEMNDQLRKNGSAGIHPPLFRRWPESLDSAHFGHFQFKSFFGRTSPMLFIASGLPEFAKYFTGQQWNLF